MDMINRLRAADTGDAPSPSQNSDAAEFWESPVRPASGAQNRPVGPPIPPPSFQPIAPTPEGVIPPTDSQESPSSAHPPPNRAPLPDAAIFDAPHRGLDSAAPTPPAAIPQSHPTPEVELSDESESRSDGEIPDGADAERGQREQSGVEDEGGALAGEDEQRDQLEESQTGEELVHAWANQPSQRGAPYNAYDDKVLLLLNPYTASSLSAMDGEHRRQLNCVAF